MDAKPRLPPIVHWRAPRFLGIAIVLAFVASLVLQPWISPPLLILVGWDVGALCYLGLGWLVIARTDETQTRLRAQRNDPSSYVIFLLVVTAASASFVALGFMVGDIKDLPFWPRAERLTLSVSASSDGGALRRTDRHVDRAWVLATAQFARRSISF